MSMGHFQIQNGSLSYHLLGILAGAVVCKSIQRLINVQMRYGWGIFKSKGQPTRSLLVELAEAYLNPCSSIFM